MRGIARAPGVRYGALVPNETGLERALAAKADEVAVFTAASESFNKRNINASIAESLARFEPVMAEAKKRERARARLRVDGVLVPVRGAHRARRRGRRREEALRPRLLRGVDRGHDRQGVAEGRARAVAAALGAAGILDRCAGHFHDTYGMARRERARGVRGRDLASSTARPAASAAARSRPGATGNVGDRGPRVALPGARRRDRSRRSAPRRGRARHRAGGRPPARRPRFQGLEPHPQRTRTIRHERIRPRVSGVRPRRRQAEVLPGLRPERHPREVQRPRLRSRRRLPASRRPARRRLRRRTTASTAPGTAGASTSRPATTSARPASACAPIPPRSRTAR